VGLAGLAIPFAGAVMVVEGAQAEVHAPFSCHRNGGDCSGRNPQPRQDRHDRPWLGLRMTGVLIVSAAWTYDAAKARGLDGALKTLRDRPFGGLLLGVAAVGLLVFGSYGLAEARYRRV
jgi:hypothetical protein